MATKVYDITTFPDRPYDNFMERSIADTSGVNTEGSSGNSDTSSGSNSSSIIGSSNSTGNGSVDTVPVKSGNSLNDLWITSFIKSDNWKSGTSGFWLDGSTGYAEFMNVKVSGNISAITGTIGGFTIGALDISASFGGNTTTISSGSVAFSSGPTGAPKTKIYQDGLLQTSAILVTGGYVGGSPVAQIGFVSNSTADIVPVGLAVSPIAITVSPDGTINSSLTISNTAIVSDTFDHYIIRYRKTVGETYYKYVDSKINSFDIGGLIPNTSYDFNIASVNKYGSVSAWSATVTQTTANSITPPATVTAGSATAGIQYVIVKWTNNSETDIASYNVYRKTTNDSSTSTLIANVKTNYFVDSGLTGGTSYYYWIKAVNTSGLVSAAYSTEVHDTPRNIITSDVGAGQITAPLTSLAAINAVSGNLNENTVGTYELQDNAVYEANIFAGAVSAAKTNIAAINAISGDLNANTVGTSQIVAGAVTSDKNNIAMRGWAQTSVFSFDGTNKATQINWGAGTFTTSDGVGYAISANNTGVMSAKTYIYFRPGLGVGQSNTEYQHSTTVTDAIGDGKVLIGIAQNNTTEAVFMIMNDNAFNIDASNIVTGSLTANEIAAGAITTDKIFAGAVTANKITSSNFVVSAGTFTNNSPIAGKVAWAGCKVVYNGIEYTITDGNCETTDKHIYWDLNSAPTTTFKKSATLPALTNDGFLVAFNDTGTATLVWNSTIINGNRITVGSVTASNIAAHTITANEITAGTITAAEIAAGTITANKLHTFNFQMTEGAFSSDVPNNQISWAGVKVVYDGVEYTITDGVCDVADKHIYWVYGAATFSHSAALPTLSNNDFLVAFNNLGVPLYVWNSTIVNGNRITTGSVTATNIAANTITANEIAAGTITADRINSNSFAFSAGTFTANDPGAGKVSWAGCKVVYKGTEYTIANDSCLTTEKHIYWQLASPTVFAKSVTLPALGNDDFLVVFNDSGTPKYVWNSTIINGNRISTGSIESTQIATGTITGGAGGNIAGGTIDNTNVLSIYAEKILIDGAATFLNTWVSYKGTYGAGTIYKRGDQVLYLGNRWNYINTTPGAGHTPAENTYWTAGGSQITTIDGGQITANTITTTQLNFVVVTDSNVIASINASTEGITIDADNITIAGSTTFVGEASAFGVPKVFYVTPTTPYRVGDLWSGGSSGDLKNCIVERLSGAYNAADWALSTKYTDDTVATSKITTFAQNGIPTSISIGDIWIDTDDGNKTYRALIAGADEIKAGEWILYQDNNKTTTFAQAAIPTSIAIGDLWADTDDSNKLYRAEMIGADEIKAGEWVLVRDSQIAIDQGRLDDIAADDKVTPVEKLIAKPIWDAIVVEATATTGTLPAQAIARGIVTTNFDAKYAALDLYLNTTLTVFLDMSATTTVVRATWNTKWNDYYDERTKLVNSIADSGVTVFTSQPTSPYFVGDLWADGTFLKKCNTQRLTGAYSAAEWEYATGYTDDTVANSKIKTFIQPIAPTAITAGDFWINTAGSPRGRNKLYRAEAIGANSIGVVGSGQWIEVPDQNKLGGTGSYAIGGGYGSANGGARVLIFPDSSTGLRVIDNKGRDVFIAYVGGSTVHGVEPGVGDVIIGDYSAGQGIKYDKSGNSTTFQGSIISGSAMLGGPTTQYRISDGGMNSFGDGTLDFTTGPGTTTLTADAYYKNLTVAAGTILNPNGWRIYCTGVLTVNGSIKRNGNNGGNATGSQYPSTVGIGAIALPDGYLKGSVAGANGSIYGTYYYYDSVGGGKFKTSPSGTPQLNGNPTPAPSGNTTVNSLGTPGIGGGNGGGGGAAGLGGNYWDWFVEGKYAPGGSGANLTAADCKLSANWHLQTLLDITAGTTYKYSASPSGGGGGGGECGAPGSYNLNSYSRGGYGGSGGGSGGPGGIMAIYARAILINAGGSIEALGGNGGNGYAGDVGGNGRYYWGNSYGNGAGGGGGGGGGAGGNGGEIILVYNDYSNLGTVSVAGGVGGNGGAGGAGGFDALGNNQASSGSAGVKGGNGATGHIRAFPLSL